MSTLGPHWGEGCNLVELVALAIQDDDESSEKASQRLTRTYENATEAERKLLNEAFISLCGWSLRSLLQKLGHDVPEVP